MAISETVPTYRQLNPKGFFCPAGYLIDENEAFEFDGTPNEDMEPLNEPARQKLLAYLKHLDQEAMKVAQKFGRSFQVRARSLDQMVFEASSDARRLELRKGDGGIPLMSAQHKGDGFVRKVVLDQAPRVIPRAKRASTAAPDSYADDLV